MSRRQSSRRSESAGTFHGHDMTRRLPPQQQKRTSPRPTPRSSACRPTLMSPHRYGTAARRGLVSIGGKTYPHGVAVDVDGFIGGNYSLTYRIPKGAHTFTAVIGADDDQPANATKDLHIVWTATVDKVDVRRGHSQADVPVSGSTWPATWFTRRPPAICPAVSALLENAGRGFGADRLSRPWTVVASLADASVGCGEDWGSAAAGQTSRPGGPGWSRGR